MWQRRLSEKILMRSQNYLQIMGVPILRFHESLRHLLLVMSQSISLTMDDMDHVIFYQNRTILNRYKCLNELILQAYSVRKVWKHNGKDTSYVRWFLMSLNAKGKSYHPKLLKICPFFLHPDFIKTTNYLANNAQLACKRCPSEVLLTPFWSLTKHLLKTNFATIW